MQLRLTMRPEHGLGTFHSHILTTANGYKAPCSLCRLLRSLSLRSMRMSTTTTTVSPAHLQPSQCKFLVSSLIFRRSHIVSVVDGFNVPMQITDNEGSLYTTCAAGLNAYCMRLSCCSTHYTAVTHYASYVRAGPDQLKGPGNGQGQFVGCNSACNAGRGGDHGTSRFLLRRCNT